MEARTKECGFSDLMHECSRLRVRVMLALE